MKMSVVSASITQPADNALSMAAEVQHCHAALLYGDEVTLISPRSALLKRVADTGSFTGVNLIRFAAEVVPYLSPEHREAIELANQLVNVPRKARNTGRARKAYRELMEGLLEAVSANQDEWVENAQRILADSGFDQLQGAIDSGILKIDDVEGVQLSTFITQQSDPVMTGFLAKIQEVLLSGNQYPLFDADVSDLVRTGLEVGMFTRVPLSRRHGSDAAMASGLFDFLPNFPHAKTSEILEIRQALETPLKAFRLGVRELTKNIDLDAESPQFGSEIEDCWNLRVRPALDEIEENIQENSGMRNLLGRAMRDGASLPGLTAAVTLGGAFGVAAGPMTTVPLAAGAAVGISVAALRAYLDQGEALKEVTGTQFYFLYGMNERMRVAS
jgi:hypothetical protein